MHFFSFYGGGDNRKVEAVAGICLEFQSIFLGAHNILFLCNLKVDGFFLIDEEV